MSQTYQFKDFRIIMSFIYCKDVNCDNRIPNHQWGKIKHDDWFIQKDGSAYCPSHIPDWVEKWRAKNVRSTAG